MFGTLIVQLPSAFTGEDLVFKHNGKSQLFKNSESSDVNCRIVAHYASCLHELKEITSGYRVALVYTLCWNGNGIRPAPHITSKKSAMRCDLISNEMACLTLILN